MIPTTDTITRDRALRHRDRRRPGRVAGRGARTPAFPREAPAFALRILLLLALPAGVADAQIDGIAGVFLEVGPELLADTPSETSSRLQDIAETPGVATIRSRLVRVVFEQLAAVRARATAEGVAGGAGANVTLNLFDDVLLSAIVERATPTASGTGYALSGRIDAADELGELGAMTLVVYGETVAGTVTGSMGTFTIQPVGDGLHAISQVDTSTLPPPGEPRSPPPAPEPSENGSPPVATGSPMASADAAADVSQIDVAVFYTRAARTGTATLTGIAGIMGLVDLMFANTNAAYERSGVMQRIRLVLLQEVGYTESGDSGTDLDRLTLKSDGFMDEVHEARDEYGADLVHLISDAKDVCGIAWLNPGEANGFALTGYNCEVADYSFAHELGHNMGLSHDRYTIWCSGQESGRPTTCSNAIRNSPHAYSYGYVNQRAFSSNATTNQAWMTIMAYDWQCSDGGYSPTTTGRYCQRLRNFSNPALSLSGDALGVPGTAASQEVTGPSDAAGTLNATRITVANFRGGRAVSTGPDLVVQSPTVSDATLIPERPFTFSATVRNEGGSPAAAATLTYWRRPTGGSWTEDGTHAVSQLSASEASFESIRLTAPTQTGTYQYAACISAVSGESDTDNNCSSAVQVTVASRSGPDLVVASASVNYDTLTPGQAFTFSATVRNQGDGAATATTLTYWQRPSGGSWTEVGSDPVGSLGTFGASEASFESIQLTAPAQVGAYEYGACVASVTAEGNTDNNCSIAVPVTVSSGGTGGGCTNDLGLVAATVSRTGSWTGSCPSVHYLGGEYARYYSFALDGSASMTIDLTSSSSVDTWLALYSGPGTGSVRLESDNDGGVGTNARIMRTLAAGTYTVEATTLLRGVTGDFTLTLAVDQGGGSEDGPDLVVQLPTVSDSDPTAGQSFTFSATVRNRGASASPLTTLTYWRRPVDGSWASVGADTVDVLSASGTSHEWIRLAAPAAGAYDYVACVSSVSGESDTDNNCSDVVRVTVISGVTSAGCTNDLGPVSGTVTRSGSWTGSCLSVHYSGGEYARYYSFTLSESASVVIDLTSVAVDTWLALRNGSGTGSGLVEDDDDGGAGTDSRIVRTLTAGTYTIEATTWLGGVTGPFALTLVVRQGGSGTAPDLVVQSPTVSEAPLTPGQSFTFSATVWNQGEGETEAATLTYWQRPSDGSWTEVGTDFVDVLSASGTSHEWIRLTAPTQAGSYDYAACVSSVSGESDSDNNCSSLVQVTVTAGCTNDLGTVTGTVTRSGSWTGSCLSVHYSGGEYARYYSFTLSESASVMVDLTSPSVDTWLALRNGSGTGSGLVEDDDDGGSGTDSRIVRTLTAGTYTIEATTWLGGVTGPFALTLTVGGSCTNNLGQVSGTVTRTGSWTDSCPSVHYPFGEYARYYSFTLGGGATVAIELTSPSVDTWLALRNGTGTGTGLIEQDNDGGQGTNARISRTLSAGTYTIEATTLRGGVTGPFTLMLTVGAASGNSPTFTDHPIVAGVTPVRAIHFTELRTRIDALREAAGLQAVPWTDPVLTAGMTPVRLVHLLELREALAAVYAGREGPSWTDAAPVAGATPITAAHLMELRAAVMALE